MASKIKDKEYIVSFVLRGVQTEQFATIDNIFKNEDTIQIQANIDFGVNEESKIIGCIAKFQFEVQNQPFIIIGVKCNFEIEPKSWDSFISAETSSITFPKDVLCHLAVITIGTARGVLHAKTENTKFNQFFLPTVNVNNLIKESITFSLEKK
ncbi:MAG: hypothetical protein HXX16_05155 [Bacteroidales bacterium]|nr:hypothetical protein [Bacteroidales bacterium]